MRPRVGTNFWLLWTAQLTSMSGGHLRTIALPLWVLGTTDSVMTMGVAFAVETLPVVVLAPWAGVLADSWDRRRLMIVGEVLSAVAAVGVLLAVRLENIPAALVGAALIKCLNTVSVPAMTGLMREVVTNDDALPRAVSRFEGLTGATLVLGPLLGASLFATYGITVAMLSNVLTFVVAAGLLYLIRHGDQSKVAREPGARPHWTDGISLLRSNPSLRRLLIAECAYFSLFGGSTAIAIILISQRLGPAATGWYPTTVGGAWLLVSMLVLPVLRWRAVQAMRVGAGLLVPVALAIHMINESSTFTVLWIAVAGVLAGLSNALIASGASLGWQRSLSVEEIGRAVAIRRSITNLSLSFSAVLLPAAGALLGFGVVIVTGAAAAGLAMWMSLHMLRLAHE